MQRALLAVWCLASLAAGELRSGMPPHAILPPNFLQPAPATASSRPLLACRAPPGCPQSAVQRPR